MANALLDFLQGASNSAAANVSAPVDGIAWLLRKAGINVDRPVMGSDWMRERGLTAEPTNKLAGILGESVGGVLPMVTAAKAPQIAQGLLQAERNLAAPRALNPQTGAILWHGSPHKFDAFDSSKIGTGEGNAAFGNGLYLADAKEVADSYAQNLSMRYSSQSPKQIREAIKEAESTLQGYMRHQTISGLKADLKNAVQAQKSGAGMPNTYKVDLPDEHIAKMLDWSKPIGEQSEAIQNLAFQNSGHLKKIVLASQKNPLNGTDSYKSIYDLPGQHLIKALGGKGGTAESLLQKAGSPGMSYLDGNSMALSGGVNTAGTRNYVVFPGNEGLLSILERNGQPIK